MVIKFLIIFQGQLQKYLSPSDIQTSILGRRVYFVCLLNFCIVIVISGINWLQIYAHYKQESVMISHIITSLFNFWIDMSRVWHLVFWCLFHEVLIRMAKIFQTLAFKVNHLNIIKLSIKSPSISTSLFLLPPFFTF